MVQLMGPAAYRYTEARLSKISNEILRDIDKNTVIMAPNFDDSRLEPTVLPCKYPNLLVNGATGISAGYATNIPTHNLAEVIEATIYRIDNPNCRLETIMNFIKGPDFPTGGIIEGLEGIKSAYETGRGKIIVKSKVTIAKDKIIINEIPYDVNKANLVRKMDEIRIDKKLEGILGVRDESDKDGLQIAIDLKKDASTESTLNYLYKNTELQISYNFNMIAIVNRRPKQLSIINILDAYIEHQKEIIYKRSEFDLAHAKKRYHIVEGLMKALSILDEVIKTIRASKNKQDAINNLIVKYEFTEEQATAIVELQLYRLTNTDVVVLKEEQANLIKIIALLESILADQDKLKSVIKDELRKIKTEYGKPRLTEIREEITELIIDNTVMLPKEDVVVVITKEGYIKRVSIRSFNANEEETLLKENDYVLGLFEMNTLDTVLLFTNKGNYLYLPVHEIPELKWRELGKHISNIISIDSEEILIGAMPVYDFEADINIISFSKLGMVKRTKLSDFQVQRYSKAINMMKLKDNDEMIDINYSSNNNVLVVTKNGYGLWYLVDEIGVVGLKASGVKAINLKSDEVVSGILFNDNEEYITIITDRGTSKRLKLSEINKGSRANRGLLLMKEIKSNPSKIIKAYVTNSKNNVGITTEKETKIVKLTEIPIFDRYSNGSYVVKDRVTNVYLESKLISKEEKNIHINIEQVEKSIKEKKLTEIDNKIMTIDDLLKDIEQER